MLRAGIFHHIESRRYLSYPVARAFTQYRRRNAMRFANRVLLSALAIFVLAGIAFGQTPRGEGDPRNLSPSVGTGGPRSEEHTSELQSRSDLVCRLLLEKKKKTKRPAYI